MLSEWQCVASCTTNNVSTQQRHHDPASWSLWVYRKRGGGGKGGVGMGKGGRAAGLALPSQHHQRVDESLKMNFRWQDREKRGGGRGEGRRRVGATGVGEGGGGRRRRGWRGHWYHPGKGEELARSVVGRRTARLSRVRGERPLVALPARR